MHRIAEDGEGAAGGPDKEFGPHHRQIGEEEAKEHPSNLGRAIAWAASGRHGWNLTGAGPSVNPKTEDLRSSYLLSMRILMLLAGAALPMTLTAQVRSGAYVARQGDAEVTRETYRFDGHTLKADVDLPSRGLRLETTTEYSSRLSPMKYQAVVKGGAGNILQDMGAVFDDSVKWTMRAGGATRNGISKISRPYSMFQNLMFSQLAV